MNILKVSHVGGDCGNTLEGNTYDAFVLADATSGEQLFRVQFNYGDDEASMKLHKLNTVAPEELAGVASAFDLIGQLHTHLMNLISESGHEFFADLFADDQPAVLLECRGVGE